MMDGMEWAPRVSARIMGMWMDRGLGALFVTYRDHHKGFN